MPLAASRLSALRALRVHRCSRRRLPDARISLPESVPLPRRRWTRGIVPLEELGLDEPPCERRPVEVVAPTAASRVQASFFACSVQPRGLPEDSFVDLGNGLCLPCPELLFLQTAEIMVPEVHALLGFELCGSYSRTARNPRSDEAVYGIPPVTTVEKIGRYLDSCGRRRSVTMARHNLKFVADNAWSPMEAIVALMASLPSYEDGYELGSTLLNVRHGTTPELVSLGCRESRVPDIEIVGTHVGFNYDGGAHLDLESIVAAAREGDPAGALADVREKHLDDLKRNRELAAMGRVILQVTSNDLFAPGGLDAVMLEAALAMEEFDGLSASYLRSALGSDAPSSRRQRLIWSLLPWPRGQEHIRELLEETPWRVPLRGLGR